MCCFLHFELSKILQLIFLFLSSTVSTSMAGHNDSEIENSYSDDSEFEEKESEILLGLSNGGVKFCGRGEGTFVCPFCELL